MESIVRICSIEIAGFKNVKHGFVPIESCNNVNESGLLGIYGQNGSGKTAVIEVMSLIQILLVGKDLPANTARYINYDMEYCEITVEFSIKTNKSVYNVVYMIRLESSNDSFIISNEKISYAKWNGVTFDKKRILINSDASDPMAYTPKYRYNALIDSNLENIVNIAVAKKLSLENKHSFIFGNEGEKLFMKNVKISESANPPFESLFLLNILHRYAMFDLFIITSKHNGPINLEWLMPVCFRVKNGNNISKGDLPIRLDSPSVIPLKEYNLITTIVAEMNMVLKTVIPNMTLQIHNHGKQLLEDGSEGYRIEILSVRGKIKIPLKYESEGIIKIISVLNVLTCVYNNSGMCVFIDELDSGLFEFLLGEILSVFEKGAKGQLIFTSHNLRALEMIDKKHLIFSTTNEANRYIKLKNVKNTNNLRDLYIRAISLGGQSEEIYAETDSVEMSRALRKAGKEFIND